LLEDFEHFTGFFVGNFFHFAFFSPVFAGVVVGIALGGEVSAQTHGYGAGRDFS